MDTLLQLWGGTFYLLNKIFLSSSENGKNGSKLRIYGWVFYLIGVPAWIIILVLQRNWIASGIEFGGIPVMVLGLVVSLRRLKKVPQLLIRSSEICAYTILAIGIAYSLYDYGGITALSQLFEIGVMAGFLIGTSMLAKKNADGWIYYMIMNVSMGSLMIIQGNSILAVQQGFSLFFVVRGYILSRYQPQNVRYSGLLKTKTA